MEEGDSNLSRENNSFLNGKKDGFISFLDILSGVKIPF